MITKHEWRETEDNKWLFTFYVQAETPNRKGEYPLVEHQVYCKNSNSAAALSLHLNALEQKGIGLNEMQELYRAREAEYRRKASE